MPTPRLALITAFIVVGIMTRLLPHPPNFTAMGAAAILSGAILGKKWISWLVPLAAMGLSDALIGFHQFMPVVYLNILLSVSLSWWLTPKSKMSSFVGLSAGAALIFFLTTNFAVWMEGVLYPPNFTGLIACYLAAIPFFNNMLCANILYIVLMVGILRSMENRFPALRAHESHPILTA